MNHLLLIFAAFTWWQTLSAQEQPMETVQKPSMMIIGIACRTSNAITEGPQDIPKLWQKFSSENILNQIPQRISDEVIALYCDYEQDHTKSYTCIIGYQVTSLENIPSGMVGKIVPASTFALYRTSGEFPQSLINTWRQIWSSSLKRTYTGDYEFYGPAFASHQEVEVLVAIE